jgi:hypothetical protein
VNGKKMLVWEGKKNEKDLTIRNRIDGIDCLHGAPDSGSA